MKKTFVPRLALLLALAVLFLQGAAVPHRLAGADASAGAVPALGGGGVPLLYQFTGVNDDGAKSVNGKTATTLICSNTGAASATIIYSVYNNTSAVEYSASIEIPAGVTKTISTQYTNLNVEDLVLGASGENGTGAIRQGMGRVFSASADILCAAQVLDPTGYPPQYITRLSLHTARNLLARSQKTLFLPVTIH